MTNKCVFCKKKNALIHELGHFMTVLKELLFSLVYYFAINKSANKFILERKQEDMKRFIKGAVVVVAIWIVLVVINVICNMNGHELDSVPSGTMAAVCAMLLYRGLARNEKNKGDGDK